MKDPAGLAQGVADHIDGGLALGLLLRVQGDVGHFLARVEEGVLAGLGQDVLRRANNDGKHQGRHPQGSSNRGEEAVEDDEGEERNPRGKQHHGSDKRRHTPPVLLEDAAAQATS